VTLQVIQISPMERLVDSRIKTENNGSLSTRTTRNRPP